MAFKMLRFSVSSIFARSIMGCCDYKVLSSTFIQSKRFQHSGIGKDSIQQLSDVKHDLGSLESAIKKSEWMQAIHFEKLQDELVVDNFLERMMEIIEDIKIIPDNKSKMDDLTKIIVKAAKDVCGTTQKIIYKCNKCNDVFSLPGSFTRHQRVCTGFITEDFNKRKCDKCLKDVLKTTFPSHYSNCKGIKESKLPRVNCPDCGKEICKEHLIKHQEKYCEGRIGWKENLVKCSKCHELFGPINIVMHMKACTGLKADDPSKRKCDKCLKEYHKRNFAIHYRTCKGINENKSARVNCPDCGKEMGIKNLNSHKRFHCRGELRSKDEDSKETYLLSDIIMKVAEKVFIVQEKPWFNITEEDLQNLRSRVTRIIKVTVSSPDYKRSDWGVCPDCGKEMNKTNIRNHQKQHCPKRLKED